MMKIEIGLRERYQSFDHRQAFEELQRVSRERNSRVNTLFQEHSGAPYQTALELTTEALPGIDSLTLEQVARKLSDGQEPPVFYATVVRK